MLYKVLSREPSVARAKRAGKRETLENQREPASVGPWWVTKKIRLLTEEAKELFK